MRLAAIIFGFALWTVAAFFAGYKLRDYRAATAAQTVQTDAQAARADAVTEARNTDHGNAQKAARGEQARISRTAAQAAHFDQLHKDIDAYALTHPTPGAGRPAADADFMHVWQAANAGAFDDATEHQRSAGTAARAEGTAAAAQQQ